MKQLQNLLLTFRLMNCCNQPFYTCLYCCILLLKACLIIVIIHKYNTSITRVLILALYLKILLFWSGYQQTHFEACNGTRDTSCVVKFDEDQHESLKLFYHMRLNITLEATNLVGSNSTSMNCYPAGWTYSIFNQIQGSTGKIQNFISVNVSLTHSG